MATHVSKPALQRTLSVRVFLLTLFAVSSAFAAPSLSILPAGNQGFDLYANGVLVAPVRLAVNGAIVADIVAATATNVYLSGLHTSDPLAVKFSTNDFVSITLPADSNAIPVVRFQLSVQSFNTNRWLALFPDGAAPFHFLVCPMPTAQVWHQRGWLNPTPLADPFSLLQDFHTGTPEISCLWNRNWSYICPLGAHPIPMIGLWDPDAALYVGYDFQGAGATDQSERYISTAYCWQQAGLTNFIALAYPYGGIKYGQQVYPRGGEILSSWFNLQVDTDLSSIQDPNDRFQARLFANYTKALPAVPAMNDLGWLPGALHLANFAGPKGLGLYVVDAATPFYDAGTVVVDGFRGQDEMPIDQAARNNDTTTINNARGRIESMLTNYAQTFPAGGDTCLFWPKPLSGSWNTTWGGPGVTTVHNSDSWYPAMVLVELYRYDRGLGQVRTNYLTAIDELFNWAKHFVWTRNEFDDVPSSPFAIGGTLSSAFLLDYYFTFRTDSSRSNNAALALDLADKLMWRYSQVWAMDSDRSDGGTVDGSFLMEPNSGRDWAGQACANEVFWCIDSLTQVYVHTGDPRLRYYLRGILQRWPALYRPIYADSIAGYTGDASCTEGLGIFDGSSAGRGVRLAYGSAQSLPMNDPIGNSTMRVVAGAKACIAFDRFDQSTDVTDYRTSGAGGCSFRIASGLGHTFDVSFTYPFVNISGFAVTRVRAGVTNTLTTQVTRPSQAPASLYIAQCQNGDIINIGNSASAPTNVFDASLVYNETNSALATNGFFITVPFSGDYLLPQSWTNLNSFAGIIPGLRWHFGVPYQQKLHAASTPVPLTVPGASVVLLTYSPPFSQTLTTSPFLVLDDSSTLPLSDHPSQTWRGWPIIFNQMVLMDYAVLPPGRSLAQINPNGTLVMAATAFTGNTNDWQPFQTTLTNASVDFVSQETQRLEVLSLQSVFSAFPTGKIAVLPLSTSGAGKNFAAASGLDKKWDLLTDQQFVDTNYFNPARYPVAFYLGSENYIKTVNTAGDGQAAVTRYLTNGGVLAIFATGPYPFFYGWGPNDASGPSDPLLPTYGLSLPGFEQPPSGVYMQRYTNQTILQSTPATFAFPPGDPRLRAMNSSSMNVSNRYQPLVRVLDSSNHYYGDAAAFVSLGAGPASGGKILYAWVSLIEGPNGQAVMADSINWLLNAVLNPPPPAIQWTLPADKSRVILSFPGQSNLDYLVQFRDSLATGSWLTLKDFGVAPTNRAFAITNSFSTGSARFYRFAIGP